MPFKIANNSLEENPQGSGVPVPGANAGSTTSISIET